MECMGAIDQGTQSTRFFLYNQECSPIASSQIEFQQLYPKSGWVEQDPLTIWESMRTAIQQTMEQAQHEHGEVVVKAIGITNQRETTLVWDRQTGEPLHNAIVWLDNRTSGICHEMYARFGSWDHFRQVTGLPISTYFSAYKLRWLLDNVPEVAEAAKAGRCLFGTVDSWLLYKLTGGRDGGIHVTDVVNAARTNLMDVRTLSWHMPTLDVFGISPNMLPEIRSNAEVYGVVKDDGPLVGVPIAGCLGDQQAALLGQRCRVHEAKSTYGTGCFVLLNTGSEVVDSAHGLLSTVGYKLGPQADTNYALEGSIAIAGQGVSWLRDAMGFIGSAAESEEVAGSVPDTAGVYFVPAFGGLLAPWWRDDARGVILGLTQYTTKAHLVRAMLEAICFQTRDVLEAQRRDAEVHQLKALFVDGGASQNDLLMQASLVQAGHVLLVVVMLADLLQVPVSRPKNLETTSLGAAIAAGIGVGFWTAEQAFNGLRGAADGTLFKPQVPREDAEQRYTKWLKAVQRSMDLQDLAD
ncbi:hypothetical protein N2152v2_009818 [Parachlorella kessleri]